VPGDREPGLRQALLPDVIPPMPSRQLWLLTHPDPRPLASIQAVTDWLATTIGALHSSDSRGEAAG
jgi:DNA-binding transcriptional LysR family regulator